MLNQTVACYCNNLDYHGLPTINFEMLSLNYQYDLDAADYLFLPYIDYNRPISLCTLAIESAISLDHSHLPNLLIGQRFITKFPMMVEFDRASNTGKMSIGGGKQASKEDDYTQVFATLLIACLLVILLIYLSVVRERRITDEEWFEENKDKLYGDDSNISEEEKFKILIDFIKDDSNIITD